MTVNVDNTLFLDWIYFSITIHFLPNSCSLKVLSLGLTAMWKVITPPFQTLHEVWSSRLGKISAILLNHGTLLNLLHFWEEKKFIQHWIWWIQRMLLTRTLQAHKSEWAGVVSWRRNQSLEFYFSHCFHNTFSCRCYWGVQTKGSFTEMTIAWFQGCTDEPKSINCDYLKDKFWESFKSVLNANVGMILLLLIQQEGHEFGGNPTNVQTVFQNDLNWPNMKLLTS